MSDVNIYATHQDLVDEVGSERKLCKLAPASTGSDPTHEIRQSVLRDVFRALARRTPPITESMISVPSELKAVVVYGSLMRLYRGAMTADGDIHSVLYRDFKKAFASEMTSLRLTVDGGASVDALSIPMFRR